MHAETFSREALSPEASTPQFSDFFSSLHFLCCTPHSSSPFIKGLPELGSSAEGGRLETKPPVGGRVGHSRLDAFSSPAPVTCKCEVPDAGLCAGSELAPAVPGGAPLVASTPPAPPRDPTKRPAAPSLGAAFPRLAGSPAGGACPYTPFEVNVVGLATPWPREATLPMLDERSR
ncbi:hypothetical protein TGFOU_404920 [Toxoplasma gondii FOU]|uniref:Uncharacterized protein n=1 Tax=Toxoplasma gondii FOU TaxID=943167 RepID=A0A086KT36_TOXGO|nr:hypothetical protein TGFOU_404920 [Toxoplasma gondii FOU]